MAGTTYTWTSTSSNVWTTPSNWTPAGPPQAGDTAIVTTGSIQINTGAINVAGLFLGGMLSVQNAGFTAASALDVSSKSGGAGNLDVETGGTVTNNGTWTFAGSNIGTTGSIEVNGAGALLNGTASFVIGNSGTGAAIISNGGMVNAGTQIAVGQVNQGNGSLIIQSGGIVTGTSTAVIGNTAGSDGDLTILSGGTLALTGAARTASNAFIIGQNGASNGTLAARGAVMVSGTGSLLNVGANNLVIGGSTGGIGSLTVQQGGSVVASSADSSALAAMLFANAASASATVIVTDTGSQITANGFVSVGRGGTAALTVENGGVFLINDAKANGGGIQIGAGRGAGPSTPANVGGNGSATVTTGGVLDVNSSVSGITVGGNGVNGILDVNNGGTVLAGDGMTIGTATSAGGTIYGGTGELDIDAGGVVRVNNPSLTGYDITIGNANSSIGGSTTGSSTDAASGKAVVSGQGALLDANGAGIAIGYLSPGSMIVSQGASVVAGTPDSNSFSALAVARRATGSLTITDPGSTLTATGAAYIARAGNGSLLIENHGRLIDGVDPNGLGGFTIGGSGLGSNSFLIVGGSATAEVTSFGTLISQQDLRVGTDGVNGSLTIDTGGTAEAGRTITIGDSVFVPSGDLIITPTGSITSTGTLIGASGTVSVGAGGTLKADGAGTAGAADIAIGTSAGTTGLLAVNGAGALVDANGGTIAIGGAGNGILTIGTGGTVAAGSFTIGSNGSVAVNGGVLSGSASSSGTLSGFGTLLGHLTNSKVIAAVGGTLDVSGGIAGTGSITINGGATFESDGILDDNQSVTFATSAVAEDLILGSPQAVNKFAINNWQNGDAIVFNNGITVTGDQWLNGTLSVFTTDGTYDFNNVNLASNTVPIFATGPDSIELVSCFAAGTRIRTACGDVAVEDLSEGDLLPQQIKGGTAPIIWIGQRTIDCTRHPDPEQVWPVHIAAGAFGGGLPQRDLYLSPDHAVYINGVLIPVKYLMNETTIVQLPRDTITYYHVELPAHDVLFAEGLTVESYLDTGDRSNFDSEREPTRLFPDFSAGRWEAYGCAPLMVAGPEVERARLMLQSAPEQQQRPGRTSQRATQR